MKLFRKIRKTLINEGNLRKYLTYAIGEILLVMIGILLALQVNSWNDGRVKMNTELRYYKNIKDQIIDDRDVILDQIEYNNKYLTQFEFANQILKANDRSKIDTLGYIALNLTDYSDFDRQGNIYETMVNSGEIKLLNNQNIIEGLRRLEETYNYINRMENIHFDVILQFAAPYIQSAIKYSNRTVQKSDTLYAFEFQNLFISFIDIMKEKDDAYNRALDEIEAIKALINEELNF